VATQDNSAAMSEIEVRSEATFRAIGRFIFEFSQLDFLIRVNVALRAGVKEEMVEAMMAGYDFGLLCRLSKKIIRSNDPARFEKVVNRILDLNDIRNKVAHGLWVPFQGGGTVYHTSRNKLEGVASEEQSSELNELAEELCNLRLEFEKIAFLSVDI
jgi:hypothetical protein